MRSNVTRPRHSSLPRPPFSRRWRCEPKDPKKVRRIEQGKAEQQEIEQMMRDSDWESLPPQEQNERLDRIHKRYRDRPE
jgi:hypothetical protein